jgi:DNA-binding MarR family transcriptional regulator
MRLTHRPLGFIPVTGPSSDDTTGELLMAVARTLRRRVQRALEKYDVTHGQSRALHVITRHGVTRPSEIADALRIAPRSATEVIDALESRGLVTRAPDPTDRRATRVEATEEGLRLSRLIADVRRAETERQLERLSDGDRTELDRILRRLLADDMP